MIRKEYKTAKGNIIYWTNDIRKDRKTLVFLPGLTADHRLFDKQVEYFKASCNVLVWDAPGHSESWPFTLDFDLFDKARWLHEIIISEGIDKPVLVGQSMGGYVGQCYLELFPEEASAFVSIDSAPLNRSYVTGIEIWLLKHIGPVYRLYPWKALKKTGINSVAVSEYGRNLMAEMIAGYDREHYYRLSSHGYGMLGKAMDTDNEYRISCPAILICGRKDMAGSAKYYNRKWSKKTGIPLYMIDGAGHNSNTDKPEEINRLIEELIR